MANPAALSSAPSAVPDSRVIRRLGWLVLALAFGLRAWLAGHGGQMFWPDEESFDVTRKIARLLLDGHPGTAASLLCSQPDHLVFKAAGLGPALLQHVLGAPDWVTALCFAAVSTWVIWLVGRTARAAGGSETESLVALVLAASTTSLFYYSRHFLPYDLALGLLLLALITGLRAATSPRNSLLTGLWAGLGYLAYHGYGGTAAVLLAAHALLALPGYRAAATRLGYALLGLALPVFVAYALSALSGHHPFAGAPGLADPVGPDRVWEIAAEYFWFTEHGLTILWGAALLLSLDSSGRPFSLRTFLWPGLVLLLGALLLVPSGLLPSPAAAARHFRVLSPFFCLLTAAALCSHPRLPLRPARLAVLLGLVALQAGGNFLPSLTQVFPREFVATADRYLAQARQADLGPYKLVNASFLHNPDWAPAQPDPGKVLVQTPHPFAYLPYLYEGYPAAIRERFLERDLSMRIVRLDVGGPPQAGYPSGMLELTLRFPTQPQSLLPEPLLSTGAPGRGDTLFIRYDGPDHFILGHDHIGGGATLSPRLPLDRRELHRVLISMDTLYPPGSRSQDSRRFVLWDDQLILNGRAELHPSTPEQITIGHNFIGTSTATLQLAADIVGFRRIPPTALGAVFPRPPGALRLRLLAPLSAQADYTEPLLSSGPAGQGDLLFMRNEGNGLFRIGHDHWGAGATLSEPFPLDPTRPADLVVAMGPFLASDAADPLRRRLYVTCNGQVIFNRYAAFHPTEAGQLGLGANLTGSTTVSPRLTMDVLASTPVAPDSVLSEPAGHPGARRLKLRFFGPPAPGQAEPLLSTGRTGAGDLLFIRFDGQGHYQVGHDHWGRSMVLSSPRPFDPSRPLELTVSLGSLHPAGAPLADRLFVATGGDVLLNQPASFHPAEARSWVVGLNLIGSSSAGELLSADLLDSSAVPAETIPPLPPAP